MRRVGGTKDIDLDVRIIVASNEKLWDASGSSKLREDLYHRFNEFSIQVAPLRERVSDIMVFANHFLAIANDELNKSIKGFHPEVERIFKTYVWYGNLRELKNVVKRATLLCDEEYVDVKKIAPKEQSLKSAGIDAEYELILEALKKVNFNKSKAAKVLQIDRKTLYNKIRQYQELRGEKFESEI